MRTRHARQLSTLVGIQRFLNDHAGELPRAQASKARRKLDALIEQAAAHGVVQYEKNVLGKGETRRLHALRRAVIEDHMAPIVAVAQSSLVDDPQLKVFRMPRGNPPTILLSTYAMGLGKCAALHADVFIDAGLPEDFVEALTSAVDAMCECQTARNLHRVDRRAVTTDIPHALRSARSVVRVLNVIVRNEARQREVDCAALLAGWNAVASRRPALALADTSSLGALPASPTRKAIASPKMKLLAGGTPARSPDASSDGNAITSLLGPLGRFFRAS